MSGCGDFSSPSRAEPPNGKVIARKRLWWPPIPSRVFRAPVGILGNIECNDGDVTLGVQR